MTLPRRPACPTCLVPVCAVSADYPCPGCCDCLGTPDDICAEFMFAAMATVFTHLVDDDTDPFDWLPSPRTCAPGITQGDLDTAWRDDTVRRVALALHRQHQITGDSLTAAPTTTDDARFHTPNRVFAGRSFTVAAQHLATDRVVVHIDATGPTGGMMPPSGVTLTTSDPADYHHIANAVRACAHWARDITTTPEPA